MSATRIVITGMGAVTGFGFEWQTLWEKCLAPNIACGHGSRTTCKRPRSRCVMQRLSTCACCRKTAKPSGLDDAAGKAQSLWLGGCHAGRR